MNLVVVFSTALIPLFIGFIWYHPKVFGNAWMKETGLDEEKLKKGNMIKIFAFTYLFSVMLAYALHFQTIHQIGFKSLFVMYQDFTTVGSEHYNDYKFIMDKYGNTYRNFRHGAVHGLVTALFLILPTLAINALFERKSFKYIFLHLGYWIISLVIMGAIICQYFAI